MTLGAAVSVRDALDGAITAIAAGGSSSPQLDAELLLADALNTSRERLRIDPLLPVEGAAVRRFQMYVRRRSVEREPVAYILGTRAFRRIELRIDSRVLVPRPETELLVDVALELPHAANVLDCCTGSGAVALAVKDERADLAVTGSDVSLAALAVAQSNAARLALDVTWRHADLLDTLGDRFDAIIANPPYVESAVLATLAPEIARHEPAIALDGGDDGLAVIARLVDQASRTRASILALEHGEGQADAVQRLALIAGFTSHERRCDLAGIERVAVCRR